nr:protein chromatin remodeling 4-like [Tanacetum cinerariifolium]GEZ78973.1 protein chromatin remodeling 4-like [Tanacetum cinerariifolium]
MIGSKVVLTYKRKRLSSTPGLGFENESPSRCQTLEVLKTPAKEEEKKSTHESEKKDPEILNQCAVYDGDSNVVHCEHCHCLYDVPGPLPSNEHLDGKNLCSSCAKQQDNVSTLEAVGSSCEDAIKVNNKPGFPLITFSRRSRFKNSVDGGSDMQEKLTDVRNNDLLAVKESNVTMNNGGPLDLSTDLTENGPNPRYCTASQEK